MQYARTHNIQHIPQRSRACGMCASQWEVRGMLGHHGNVWGLVGQHRFHSDFSVFLTLFTHLERKCDE